MYRIARFLILPAELLLATALVAQGTSSQATATCNFNANNQIAVEYQRSAQNFTTSEGVGAPRQTVA